MFELNTNIIIDSEIKTFVFKLEKEEIKYNIFDHSLNLLNSTSLPDKGVKLYSVYIDLDNIIHLVALLSAGELNYYKYIDEQWSKGTIANFDLKANIYNQIKIFTVKNKLHLIYNYSNLINSHIWTLQHVIYDKANGEKHNIIRYISKRAPDPFFVDIDRLGTIHLFYKTDLSTISQIHHTFYNPYTNNWISSPKQISSEGINNLDFYLFIDSYNNLHGLLLEELNNRCKIKYLRMSSKGKEKYIWKEISLPYILISNYPPIIFQEDNNLKLLYLSDNKIKYITSTDYGITWSIENIIDSLDDNHSIVEVSSNLLSKKHKINHSYFSNPDNPKLNSLNIFSNTTFSLEEISSEVINEEIKLEILEEVDIAPNILNDLNNKMDQLILNYETYESFISIMISNQVDLENILNNIQISLDKNNQSFLSKVFKSSK
jgi:hypothetical protein